MYTIDIEYPDRQPETQYLDDERVTIGCDGGDIPLGAPGVGEPHAELRFDGRTVTFVDLGSAMGSFDQHGERLRGSRELAVGDAIRIGPCTIVLRDVEGVEGTAGATAGAPDAGAETASGAGAEAASGAGGGDGAPAAETPLEQAASRLASAIQQGADRVAREVDARTSGAGPDGTAGAIKRGIELVRPQAAQALLIMGILLVVPPLVDLAVGWIPVLGWLATGLVRLGAGLAGPLGAAALSYYMLAAHLQAPVSGVQAWRTVLKQPLLVWTSFFVAGLVTGIGTAFLIVPGIALGFFLGPVFFVEKRRYLHINMRCVQYFTRAPVRLIVLVLVAGVLPAIAIGVAAGLVDAILGILPLVGDHLGSTLAELISAAGSTAILTVMAAIATRLYFELREKMDGRPHEDEARAALAWFAQGPGSSSKSRT